MKRPVPRAVAIAAALAAIATALFGGSAAPCNPAIGRGHLAVCVPHRAPLSTGRSPATGVDCANYQGLPDWARAQRAGLRFAICQTNDGTGFRDWNFTANWQRLRSLHIPHGAYLFARPGCGWCQADLLANAVFAAGGMDRLALPPAIDAEVPGAYERVCEIASRLRYRLHVAVVLTYTSPGLWPGGAVCGTLLWVADYGVRYPTNASSWRFHVAWQYCGTCAFPGVGREVDLDLASGLLSLLPAPPTPKPSRAALIAGREAVRSLLTIYRCRVVHGRRAFRGCPTLAREGRQIVRALRRA